MSSRAERSRSGNTSVGDEQSWMIAKNEDELLAFMYAAGAIPYASVQIHVSPDTLAEAGIVGHCQELEEAVKNGGGVVHISLPMSESGNNEPPRADWEAFMQHFLVFQSSPPANRGAMWEAMYSRRQRLKQRESA